MSDIVFGIIHAAWTMLTMASPYILSGLFIAGLMRAFVKPEHIARHLGGNNVRSVGLAALAGVPIPLCSCGVVPTAMGLHQQGASKSATIAFLISTPESGIDSIAVTYALLGPVMAIIRPIAACFTAFVAGLGQIALENRVDVSMYKTPQKYTSTPRYIERNLTDRQPTTHVSIIARLRTGLHYAFVVLLRDMSGWFLVGILIGGVISYAIPESFIQNYLGTGWQAMLVMLAIGIPLYICASASTPIAAALIAKGMSPGVALVFLLAGPATNLASLPVLINFLGKRTVAIYLATIAVCSILFGTVTNLLAAHFTITPVVGMPHAEHHPIPPFIMTVTAVLLLTMIVIVQGATYLQRQRTRSTQK